MEKRRKESNSLHPTWGGGHFNRATRPEDIKMCEGKEEGKRRKMCTGV